MEKIIPRHSPLPAHASHVFTTAEDGQRAMRIHVIQGERELAKECRSLGTIELTDIPPLPKGRARITISFALDVDGLLTVTAKEETSGQPVSLVLNSVRGLSHDFIEDTLSHEGDDVLVRLWIQKVNQAQDALREIRRFSHGNDIIEQACDDLEKLCEKQGTPEDLKHLISAWDSFADLAISFVENHLTQMLKSHFES